MNSDLSPSLLREALDALGAVLDRQEEHFDLVVIGAATLSLRGIIARSTGDVDVLGHLTATSIVSAYPLPTPVADAALQVAAALGLTESWFGDARTTGLLEQAHGLPPGMQGRLEPFAFGRRLTLHLAHRRDVIAMKLDAIVTRGDTVPGKHHQDLQALGPDASELADAVAWVSTGFVPGDEQGELLLRAVRWLTGDDTWTP